MGSGVRARPGDIVDEVCLQQKLTAREQVLGNEILVGAHSHAITHTQGTQHIQHLEVKVRGQKARAPGQESMGGPGWEAVSGQEMGILTRGGGESGRSGITEKVKGQRQRSNERLGLS